MRIPGTDWYARVYRLKGKNKKIDCKTDLLDMAIFRWYSYWFFEIELNDWTDMND